MKHKRMIIAIALLMALATYQTYAQQGDVAAGGEVSGSGGIISFSTGQTDFLYFYSESGCIQYGMQQGFFFDDRLALPENMDYQETFQSPVWEESKKVFMKVYPNPTKGDFTLEIPGAVGEEHVVTVEIIGMRGELVKRTVFISSPKYPLSLHGHNPGLYLIRVQIGDQFGIERIVKR